MSNIWNDYNNALIELINCYKNGCTLNQVHEKEVKLNNITKNNIKTCMPNLNDEELVDIIEININDELKIMYINISHPLLVSLTFIPENYDYELSMENSNKQIDVENGCYVTHDINLCIIVE